MSYTALYRKWRPAVFDDVKGQDAIVKTLQNQIKSNRIGHAYLFCGTRGTGKTSVAKIFARAVNCENPENGNPCGKCRSCLEIATGNSMNVIEIDAASNNGVDNVREIRENVAYSPTNAKYKVYIIDEVHMLSTGAFNALLKTLEEPPSYVIFILATTESHKIPVTILSRCQRYDFKRISIDTLTERLNEIMENEGIKAEDKAVRYIAKTAEGGMRDAISLLDQCVAFYLGKEITYDDALEVLGAVDTGVFSAFLRAITAESVVDAVHLLDKITSQGRDLNQFVIDFTWYLRNVLMVKTSRDANEIVDISKENLKYLREEADALEAERLIRYIRIFSEVSNDLRYAAQKRIVLEIAVIKLCRPQMEKDDTSVLERVRVLEDKVKSGDFSEGITEEEKQERRAKQIREEKEREEKQKEQKKLLENIPKATQEQLGKVAATWKNILRNVDERYRPCLREAVPSIRPADGKLIILFKNDTHLALTKGDEFDEQITAAFLKEIGAKVEYELDVISNKNDKSKEYPAASIFGNMAVEIDDSEFDNE